SYHITEENVYGSIQFKIPFVFQSYINPHQSIDVTKAARLAKEMESLSTSLPLSPSASIFVCYDEARPDVMKALITGPSNTPYANGCFEFDIFFPPNYPSVPMMVNLITTGQGMVRFNPNLYNNGTVCLSILNTWSGSPAEMWNSLTSNLLQVLVSIQSLVLVEQPYFNEPGYEQTLGSLHGTTESFVYNANIYVSTLQWAILNQLKNPSPCFKDVCAISFSI
ncbi:hypothetical protein EMCRGX_G008053, partial [Ephydatia muelleri]